MRRLYKQSWAQTSRVGVGVGEDAGRLCRQVHTLLTGGQWQDLSLGDARTQGHKHH